MEINTQGPETKSAEVSRRRFLVRSILLTSGVLGGFAAKEVYDSINSSETANIWADPQSLDISEEVKEALYDKNKDPVFRAATVAILTERDTRLGGLTEINNRLYVRTFDAGLKRNNQTGYLFFPGIGLVGVGIDDLEVQLGTGLVPADAGNEVLLPLKGAVRDRVSEEIKRGTVQPLRLAQDSLSKQTKQASANPFTGQIEPLAYADERQGMVLLLPDTDQDKAVMPFCNGQVGQAVLKLNGDSLEPEVYGMMFMAVNLEFKKNIDNQSGKPSNSGEPCPNGVLALPNTAHRVLV